MGDAPQAPTKLPKAGDQDVVYVLDVSGYVFRAYHAIPPLSTSKGEPTHAVHGFTNMLLKLIDQQKPVRFAVAMDSKGPSFRKELFPAYKENRKQAPPDLSQQLARCREIIDAYQIPCFEAPGVEADDLIATFVRRAREKGLRVVIVSADKDLLQLVGDGVIMYDTMWDRIYGPLETQAKMGVPPEQVRDLLALMGDSSDNIPGVPGVGPKTAKQLLDDYGDIDGIYAHLDEITRKATKNKLEQHRAEAYLSRDLVTLRDDATVEADLDALRWSGGDAKRLRELFTELELHRLLNQIVARTAVHVATELDTILTADELDEALAAIREAGRVAFYTAVDRNDPLEGDLCGIALAWRDDRAAYVPFSHRYLGAPAQLPAEKALAALRPLLEDPAFPKLSSDLKRDEVVLARHGVAFRGGVFDTTIASYLLESGKHSHDLEEVARGEMQVDLIPYDAIVEKQKGKRHQLLLEEVDVERGRDFAAQRAAVIWAAAGPLRERIEEEGFATLMHDVEIPLAHVLADMETTGVRVDVDYLQAMGAELAVQIRDLERRCHELAGQEFNVGSPRQLETILFDDLKLPVIKRTKTARSTDADVLEELAASHDLPAAIVEHRTLSKLKSTYLDALPKQVSAATGRVHTRYNQAVAATGRLSSSDPNLQNIPIRTDIGRRIREAFVTEPGFQILSADYSQIELRVLAHLSSDPELIDAFRGGVDVHTRTATALFAVKPEDVNREQRGQAKTVNYAVIYGQSHFALARNLRIERREAMRYIEAFFERYAGVKRYMEEIIEDARRTGGTRTIMGRRRMLPDLHSRNRQLRMAAERVARNTPIQGSAADIMKAAMVAIHRAMVAGAMRANMILTVHDELVFEAPPQEKDALERIVREHMEHAVELKVPLVVDHGWGRTWGQAH
jgi:DNA polymerase-1